MKKEITKGTQKFIWHLAAFVAVFILALVAINKFAPSTTPTTVPNSTQQSVSTEQTLPQGSDFDSVKERVDYANNTTGKEVQSLYSDEGKTVAQRQAESRLFFSNLKNVLFCILLVVIIIVLIRKGFNLKKIKDMFTGDEDKEKPENDTDTEGDDKPKTDGENKPETSQDKQDEDPDTEVKDTVPSETEEDDEEPPLVEEDEPGKETSDDEKDVAENCKF